MNTADGQAIKVVGTQNNDKRNHGQRGQAWKILRDAAQAVGVTTHTLRKTFGYHAYQSGVDLAVIQQILNHSSRGTTLAYIGIRREDRDAVYLNLQQGSWYYIRETTGQGGERVARKTIAQDAQIGRTLWLKDHGGWRAIVVQAVVTSVKGPQGNFWDLDGWGTVSVCSWTATDRSLHGRGRPSPVPQVHSVPMYGCLS